MSKDKEGGDKIFLVLLILSLSSSRSFFFSFGERYIIMQIDDVIEIANVFSFEI